MDKLSFDVAKEQLAEETDIIPFFSFIFIFILILYIFFEIKLIFIFFHTLHIKFIKNYIF